MREESSREQQFTWARRASLPGSLWQPN